MVIPTDKGTKHIEDHNVDTQGYWVESWFLPCKDVYSGYVNWLIGIFPITSFLKPDTLYLVLIFVPEEEEEGFYILETLIVFITSCRRSRRILYYIKFFFLTTCQYLWHATSNFDQLWSK